MKTMVFSALLIGALLGLGTDFDEVINIKNASEAKEACLNYLRQRNPQIAPEPSVQWQEQTIFSDAPIDLVTTSKQYRSDAWIVEVSQNLAPLRKTEYQVTVFSPELGWHWKGRIKADGSINEESPFRLLSDQEKGKMIEELLRKSKVRAPVGGYGH